MTTLRSVLLVATLGVVTLGGCKKTWTPFYQLDTQQQLLVLRDGDEAYVSSEMQTIISSLEAAPERAIEREKALALAAKLKSEVARVQAAKLAEAERNRPTTAVVRPAFEPSRPAPPPPPAEVDAGEPTEPWQGMTEAEFLKTFGEACFTRGPDGVGPDGGAATTQLVNADPQCIERFGMPGRETRHVFLVASGYWGSLSRQPPVKTTVYPDASVPAPPPPPSTLADAGERVLTIPGAPVRENYQRDFGDGGY